MWRVETLLWPQMKPGSKQAKVVARFVARLARRYSSWNLPRDRRELFEFLRDQAKALEKDLKRRRKEWKGLLGDVDPEQPFEVHNIYPRQRIGPNAFYSPAKKAVLFGYFPTRIGENGTSVTVFTCLSHDIIAHEVTCATRRHAPAVRRAEQCGRAGVSRSLCGPGCALPAFLAAGEY